MKQTNLPFGFYNMDCLEGMKQFEDNYFDLAIVDPPYGGGGKDPNNDMDFTKNIKAERTNGGTWAKKYQVHRNSKPGGQHKNYTKGSNVCDWDYAPDKEYFDELFRISKNQIIWGGELL